MNQTMNPITLTQDQQNALTAFTAFLADEAAPVFVLKGYSGTGKSTMIKELIAQLPTIYKTIRLISPKFPSYELKFTATTNKAVENFSQLIGQEVSTIHSFLGLTVQTDYKTNKSKLVLRKFIEQQGFLLFIDESSYIGPELMKYVFQLCKHCKIVFIGDPAQLVEVGSSYAPVFEAGFPEACLTQVVRQAAGNPIIDLATKFRETVKSGEFFSFTPDDNHIKYLPRDEFNAAVLNEFQQANWNPQVSKVLAWTNATVIQYNKGIRDHAKGSPDLSVGDYVVCNQYFQKGKMSLKADQSVMITHVSDPVVELGVRGKFYIVNGIQAFCPDHLGEKQERLKQAKQEDDLNTSRIISEEWIDLRAEYACTINKSQGSTYDRVFIDLDDIKKCNNGNLVARMLYVGVSRARKQVIFTGDLV